jgi:hypothetical protein
LCSLPLLLGRAEAADAVGVVSDLARKLGLSLACVVKSASALDKSIDSIDSHSDMFALALGVIKELGGANWEVLSDHEFSALGAQTGLTDRRGDVAGNAEPDVLGITRGGCTASGSFTPVLADALNTWKWVAIGINVGRVHAAHVDDLAMGSNLGFAHVLQHFDGISVLIKEHDLVAGVCVLVDVGIGTKACGRSWGRISWFLPALAGALLGSAISLQSVFNAEASIDNIGFVIKGTDKLTLVGVAVGVAESVRNAAANLIGGFLASTLELLTLKPGTRSSDGDNLVVGKGTDALFLWGAGGSGGGVGNA